MNKNRGVRIKCLHARQRLGFEFVVHNAGTLVGSTVATCLFFNVTASDQYLSIVIPGRMYAKKFRDMGFKPELLSRSLEDSGTVTSVLIPWNTCGATQSSVLGVSTWAYAPYCIFNIISPFMSVFIASKAACAASRQAGSIHASGFVDGARRRFRGSLSGGRP